MRHGTRAGQASSRARSTRRTTTTRRSSSRHDFADISTGCNSHIGRGGQFSLFLTGWDARKLRDIVTGKLENLEQALNGCDAARGGLASYIDPALLGSKKKKNTLAYWTGQGRRRLAVQERRGHGGRARLASWR